MEIVKSLIGVIENEITNFEIEISVKTIDVKKTTIKNDSCLLFYNLRTEMVAEPMSTLAPVGLNK